MKNAQLVVVVVVVGESGIWVNGRVREGERLGPFRILETDLAFESSSDALLASGTVISRSKLPMFVVVNECFHHHQCSKCSCCLQQSSNRMPLFLDHQNSSPTTTWGKREVDQEELVVTCLLRAPAIALYPSTTFAVHRTSSSQSSSDRNRSGTHRPWQLKFFFSSRSSERETVVGVLFGSFSMVGSQIGEGTQISNIIRKGRICGLRTDETCHGWQQDGCNGTRHNAIEHFCIECGHLECHDIGTHEMWARGHKAQEPFQQLQQDSACPISVTFVAVVNACASVVTIEEDRCAQE